MSSQQPYDPWENPSEWVGKIAGRPPRRDPIRNLFPNYEDFKEYMDRAAKKMNSYEDFENYIMTKARGLDWKKLKVEQPTPEEIAAEQKRREDIERSGMEEAGMFKLKPKVNIWPPGITLETDADVQDKRRQLNQILKPALGAALAPGKLALEGLGKLGVPTGEMLASTKKALAPPPAQAPFEEILPQIGSLGGMIAGGPGQIGGTVGKALAKNVTPLIVKGLTKWVGPKAGQIFGKAIGGLVAESQGLGVTLAAASEDLAEIPESYMHGAKIGTAFFLGKFANLKRMPKTGQIFRQMFTRVVAKQMDEYDPSGVRNIVEFTDKAPFIKFNFEDMTPQEWYNELLFTWFSRKKVNPKEFFKTIEQLRGELTAEAGKEHIKAWEIFESTHGPEGRPARFVDIPGMGRVPLEGFLNRQYQSEDFMEQIKSADAFNQQRGKEPTVKEVLEPKPELKPEVGKVRENVRLAEAKERLRDIPEEVEHFEGREGYALEIANLRNEQAQLVQWVREYVVETPEVKLPVPVLGEEPKIRGGVKYPGKPKPGGASDTDYAKIVVDLASRDISFRHWPEDVQEWAKEQKRIGLQKAGEGKLGPVATAEEKPMPPIPPEKQEALKKSLAEARGEEPTVEEVLEPEKPKVEEPTKKPVEKKKKSALERILEEDEKVVTKKAVKKHGKEKVSDSVLDQILKLEKDMDPETVKELKAADEVTVRDILDVGEIPNEAWVRIFGAADKVKPLSPAEITLFQAKGGKVTVFAPTGLIEEAATKIGSRKISKNPDRGFWVQGVVNKYGRTEFFPTESAAKIARDSQTKKLTKKMKVERQNYIEFTKPTVELVAELEEWIKHEGKEYKPIKFPKTKLAHVLNKLATGTDVGDLSIKDLEVLRNKGYEIQIQKLRGEYKPKVKKIVPRMEPKRGKDVTIGEWEERQRLIKKHEITGKEEVIANIDKSIARAEKFHKWAEKKGQAKTVKDTAEFIKDLKKRRAERVKTSPHGMQYVHAGLDVRQGIRELGEHLWHRWYGPENYAKTEAQAFTQQVIEAVDKERGPVIGYRMINNFRRFGPGGKKIAEFADKYVMKRSQYEQRALDNFLFGHALVAKGMGARRKGILNRAKMNKQIGERIYNLLERKAEPANVQESLGIEIIRNEVKAVADKAIALDIMVTGSSSKKKFEERENYAPRRYDNKELRKFFQDPEFAHSRDKYIDRIAKNMFKDQPDPKVAREMAETYFKEMRDALKSRQWGHLERERLLSDGELRHLEREWTKKNPGKKFPLTPERTSESLIKYFVGSWDRLAWIEQFGQEMIMRKDIMVPTKFSNALSEIKNPDHIDYVKKAMKQYLGQSAAISNKLVRFGRMYRTLNVAKLAFAFIPNSLQWFTNTVPKVSIKAALQAGYDVAGYYGLRGKEVKAEMNEFISKTGVSTFKNAYNMVMNENPMAANKIAETFLKIHLFVPTEAMNAVYAGFAGKRYAAHTMEKLFRGRGKSRRSPFYINELKKLGFSQKDVDFVIENGPLTGKYFQQAADAAFRMRQATQFLADAFNLPTWWSKPEGRVATQFKNFAYNQTLLIKDNLKEFGQWFRTGGKEGDPTKAMKMLPAVMLAGTMIHKFKKKLYKNIGMHYYEELWAGRSWPMKSLMLIGQTGGFGIAFDVFGSLAMGKSQFAATLGGPLISDSFEFADAIVKTWNELFTGFEHKSPDWIKKRAGHIGHYWLKFGERLSPDIKAGIQAFFADYRQAKTVGNWSGVVTEAYGKYKELYMMQSRAKADKFWEAFMQTQGKEYHDLIGKWPTKPTYKQILRWWEDIGKAVGKGMKERAPGTKDEKKLSEWWNLEYWR